jgi:pimeloyl-ACP methyl ester carboxylesterase
MRKVLVAAVALLLGIAAQAPGRWLSALGAHYSVFYQPGFEGDVPFTRRWLDVTEQLMKSKYAVTPDRYNMSVYLLPAPAGDIDTNTSGQNQCCTNRTGTIRLLSLSAPVWKTSNLKSSLGLPKSGEDYHAKVIVSEYIPIGHLAAQDARPAGGWTYYDAPDWFVQGLQEYDAIFHSTDRNRTATKAALLDWARTHAGGFACCAQGLQMADVYNGGAAFMTFLATQFGEDVHARLLRDPAATFAGALANQTMPYELPLLYDRFRAWLAAPEAAEPAADQFVTVNGIRLQYLDWGGRGDAVLFLPGLGDNVHRFDSVAPHFTDRFHVLGLSRRGQGQSAAPATGYDTISLAEDIRAFLDAMRIDAVDLIGHSIAGGEMTRFAERYPQRVRHLVYLDAAYDMADGFEAAKKAKLPVSARADSPIDKINLEARHTHLDYKKVQAPALAFYALYATADDPAGIVPAKRPHTAQTFPIVELGYKREQVKIFRRDMKRGRVVEFFDTDHFFFVDPRKTASVVSTIRDFLAQP